MKSYDDGNGLTPDFGPPCGLRSHIPSVVGFISREVHPPFAGPIIENIWLRLILKIVGPSVAGANDFDVIG